MTAQYPEILLNDHPRIAFDNLSLYFLFRGEVRGERERLTLPVAPAYVPQHNCSALWRGYIATFRLAPDGTLALVSYAFEIPNLATDTVPMIAQDVTGGLITGDFWLAMRPFFGGPNTYVRFLDGRIVEDRTAWVIDDQTLRGRITRKHREAGLVVDICELGDCFLPRDLIPPKLRADLGALIGLNVDCEIHEFDDEKRSVIVQPIRFPQTGTEQTVRD